jgi:hypothetical protein
MNNCAPRSLAELFCQQHFIARERFELAFIERALPPRAYALHRLFQLMPADYFASDIELMRRIGEITSPAELESVVRAFHANPISRRALRRRIKVCLSLPRLRRIVAQTFARSEGIASEARLTAA